MEEHVCTQGGRHWALILACARRLVAQRGRTLPRTLSAFTIAIRVFSSSSCLPPPLFFFFFGMVTLLNCGAATVNNLQSVCSDMAPIDGSAASK